MRVPASFCGLYGIRPTHGRLDLTGHAAAGAELGHDRLVRARRRTFARVSEVMLGEPIPTRPADQARRRGRRVRPRGRRDRGRAPADGARLSTLVGEVREDLLAPPGLSVWARAQRTLQPYEAWLTFKEWLDRDNPRLQFSVARGLALASTIPESERQLGRADARRGARAPGVAAAAGHHPVHADHPVPRAPEGALPRALDPLRARISCLTSHGGLTGVPQVSLPGATVDGLPVGLSILARAAVTPPWSRWRAMEASDDRRDAEHARGRGRGARAVRALRAGADRQGRRGPRRHVLGQPAHDPLRAHENGYGFAQIHGHRVARPPGPGIKEKRIRLEILTLGRDLATVNLEFKVRGAIWSAGRARPGCAFPPRPRARGNMTTP